MLTEYDLSRYKRQIQYPPLGEEGQEKLKKAHVVVAGVGGLGCPGALYLAAAGIGRLTIIDDDVVSLSNLNRQLLHYDGDIGRAKVASGADKLGLLNPAVRITSVRKRIEPDNAADLIAGGQVVIDGLDNFETRLILNRACVDLGIPFIHGGIHGLLGEATTIIPGKTPCFACLCQDVPEQDEEIPALGPLTGMIACVQAVEAIKCLAGFGTLLAGRMLFIDASDMTFSTIHIERTKHCPVCGVGEP
ncbi:MAG: HesA/MoeB/ThiF family protein [Syntrophales bacterium]|jgi:adenylyltransferase/sulfurtransferase|nr:HesA/MoeB/ThiF family protein [Syntrophales bacterium]NLN60571.1 HesA/MoeB/ThiF family protein [Deltaproteobacteria bacterium]